MLIDIAPTLGGSYYKDAPTVKQMKSMADAAAAASKTNEVKHTAGAVKEKVLVSK